MARTIPVTALPERGPELLLHISQRWPPEQCVNGAGNIMLAIARSACIIRIALFLRLLRRTMTPYADSIRIIILLFEESGKDRVSLIPAGMTKCSGR